MSEMFRPLSVYAKVPPASFPGLDAYEPWVAPRGLWPAPRGGAGATGRSAEPLVGDRWKLAWETPLGAAEGPGALLVDGDAVYVEGAGARAIFAHDGRPIGAAASGGGDALLAAGDRLLADDAQGGLFTYLRPAGTRDARIVLASPTGHATRRLLAGPADVLAILSVRHGSVGEPQSVVETVRARDWARTGEHGILYGLEPLAGLVREGDDSVDAAAARPGPVLTCERGLRWCDWQLRTLAERDRDGRPLAISVDEAGRAWEVYARGLDARLAIVPPAGPPVCDLELPWTPAVVTPPPTLSAAGVGYLTPAGHVLALDASGKVLWHRDRAGRAPGTVTANGLLLASGEDLVAFSPQGDTYPLWRPPAPIRTAAVLARGRIHVATHGMLHVLEPA